MHLVTCGTCHTGLGTLGMVGGGGGGGGYIHIFFWSRMDFQQIVYCMETPKFVVATKWLQLSTVLYRNPMLTTKYFYCINPKVVNCITTLTSSSVF